MNSPLRRGGGRGGVSDADFPIKKEKKENGFCPIISLRHTILSIFGWGDPSQP